MLLVFIVVNFKSQFLSRLGGLVGYRAFDPRSGLIKSNKLTLVASLVSVHHLQDSTGLIGPVSV